MTVKEHYEKHLGNFYSWMTGDFEKNKKGFQKFLEENEIAPLSTKTAIDLGAGHGIQSVPLAELGFKVISVDFNEQLLNELKFNAGKLNIEIINEDIKNVKQLSEKNPELIICCGDTVTHLESKYEIEELIKDISIALVKGGKVLLSFRDYSAELKGDSRFIPVKNDENKILTCILEYERDLVRVTDLFHEKTDKGWIQKISSYNKVRVLESEIIDLLKGNGLKIILNKVVDRLITIIAVKP